MLIATNSNQLNFGGHSLLIAVIILIPIILISFATIYFGYLNKKEIKGY